MGKKYIIELEDEKFTNTKYPLFNNETLYRVKGFKTLVFDQSGLDKLTEYKSDDSYNRGLEDAWGVARKLISLDEDERRKKFVNNTYTDYIINNWTVYDVMDKLDTDEKLVVGDEVFTDDDIKNIIEMYEKSIKAIESMKATIRGTNKEPYIPGGF